ncbi:MAG: PfkB family carbohydrate kinase [bacterium]
MMQSCSSGSARIPMVVVGAVELDTVITPFDRKGDVLGGSSSYASLAASYYGPVGMVGVVGLDFPSSCIATYMRAGIETSGLHKANGRTFRWSGEYQLSMREPRTISSELNVFAGFKPELPESYRRSPYLFLANMSPTRQLEVLAQVRRPRFVAVDTMALWIQNDRTKLNQVVGKADMLMLKDSEARMLSGHHNIVKAARDILRMGPEYLVVRKDEHGAMLFSKSGMFIIPAYPVEEVRDPTGAGDTFAGGFIGSLSMAETIDAKAICEAMVQGSVMASFGVEEFGVSRLTNLSRSEIRSRTDRFRKVMAGF